MTFLHVDLIIIFLDNSSNTVEYSRNSASKHNYNERKFKAKTILLIEDQYCTY